MNTLLDLRGFIALTYHDCGLHCGRIKGVARRYILKEESHLQNG